jgi:ABC-type thiamin/hydroxymethylpyrimidine transport system permease subunit
MKSVVSGWTLRNWITLGLLGALWGAVELSLGSVLHMIFPPLANTFLTGVILSALGTVFALTGKVLIKRRGTILFISSIAALLKLLCFGGVRLGPFLAILIQGILMEACFLPANRLRRVQFIAAGMLSVGWNLFHRFLMLRLLYGRSFVQVAVMTAQAGGGLFDFGAERVLIVLGLLFAIRLAVGAAAGWASLGIGLSLEERLGSRYEDE